MSHQRIQVLGPAQRVISSDGRLTVTIPIKMRLGGVRRVKPPDGPPKLLTSLQHSLIQAHRWQRMLDRGEVTQIGELARQENQDHAYVSRLLNLTTLSPRIVEAILDDRVDDGIGVKDLAINPPMLWSDQCLPQAGR